MLPNDIVVYDSLNENSIPTREERSVIRRWFEQAVLSGKPPINPGQHIKSGLSVFRKTTEALGTGAALAAIHVETDNGLDKFGIPLDGVGGALLAMGSAFWPNAEVSSDARDIGADAMTVFAFRKTQELLVEKRLAAGRAVPQHLMPGASVEREGASHAGEDPIVSAGRNL